MTTKTRKPFDLQAYARVWAADPERAFRELMPGSAGSGALTTLNDFTLSTKAMRQLNESLLPMVATLGDGAGRNGWWARFSGAALEREVKFAQVAESVESVAAECRQTAAAIRNQMLALRKEIALLDQDHAKMGVRIELGLLMLESPELAPRFAAAAGAELLDRFRRKLANVESLQVAQKLTRAQYELAISNGVAMLERFEEIMTLLLPLWYQRMGFEMFSRSLEETA